MLRQTGVLCPLSALPGAPHIGDLGAGARRWVDHLARHGVEVWQLLPLHPTSAAFGNSPYSASSVFAGDERYVSVEAFGGSGVQKSESTRDAGVSGAVDYDEALRVRRGVIDALWAAPPAELLQEFEFWRQPNLWVDDYALWRVLADERGTDEWTAWPAELRAPDTDAVAAFAKTHRDAIRRVAFGQFLFARQFADLRDYAAERGVQLLGDLPIYPHLDSADVWANREAFRLDADTGRPTVVAGVPPDYFSETGQLWGNPVYDWDRLAADDFAWWRERLRYACHQYGRVRIDHFIGLARAYEVPAGDADARGGSYRDVPTDALLRALARDLPGLPIVAEDLGAEHPATALALERWRLPGMRVLQFGFGGASDNPHLPHNYPRTCVAYTGTHDNDTARGWYTGGASAEERAHLRRYAGGGAVDTVSPGEAVAMMLRLLLASPAALRIAPVQDVLGLGGEARVNTPGTARGNWTWRAGEGELYGEGAWERFGGLLATYR